MCHDHILLALRRERRTVTCQKSNTKVFLTWGEKKAEIIPSLAGPSPNRNPNYKHQALTIWLLLNGVHYTVFNTPNNITIRHKTTLHDIKVTYCKERYMNYNPSRLWTLPFRTFSKRVSGWTNSPVFTLLGYGPQSAQRYKIMPGLRRIMDMGQVCEYPDSTIQGIDRIIMADDHDIK